MEFPLTVNSQEAFDALIKGRLERARQQWESESGLAQARDAAREASSRAEAAEARARHKLATRDARSILKDMGVGDRSRQERILRLADLEVGFDEQGEPNEKDLRRAIKSVHADLPEVFGETPACSRARRTPARDPRGRGRRPRSQAKSRSKRCPPSRSTATGTGSPRSCVASAK